MKVTVEMKFENDSQGDNKIDCQNLEKELQAILQRVKVHGQSADAMSGVIFDTDGNNIGSTIVTIE